MVRTAGLEPAQGFPQGILSPLRLPFRHVRESGQLHNVRGCGQLYDAADADNYTVPMKADNYTRFAKVISCEPTTTQHPREAT
jgi:hypothetical protein